MAAKPDSPATNKPFDVLFLYNQREAERVRLIVEKVEKQGYKVFFWDLKVGFGTSVEGQEENVLKEVSAVVICLGSAGWGPNHLRLAKLAAARQQDQVAAGTSPLKIIPLLIDQVIDKEMEELPAVFKDLRRLQIFEISDYNISLLIEAIGKPRAETTNGTEPVSKSISFNELINTLIDGNEAERSAVLARIRTLDEFAKIMLAQRLRNEITNNFGPRNEDNMQKAIRPPGNMPGIRSWMLSALLEADAISTESKLVLLKHTKLEDEPEVNVRYWAIAGLYRHKVPYLDELTASIPYNVEPVIQFLLRSIKITADPGLKEDMRSYLMSGVSDNRWAVLRTLRVVAIPELAPEICSLIETSAPQDTIAYDAFYVLTNPEMAKAARDIFMKSIGTAGIIQRMTGIFVATNSNTRNSNTIRDLTQVLTLFPYKEVDKEIAALRNDPATRNISVMIRNVLNTYRIQDDNNIVNAGYNADGIDVSKDYLNIKADVRSLTAIMLSKEVTPPLAIGLFGSWGSGKSFFIRSIQAEAKRISDKFTGKEGSPYHSDIVQIEFNAWNYADDNLWANLVTFIFEKLDEHVTFRESENQKAANIVTQIVVQKSIVQIEETKQQETTDLIAGKEKELAALQTARLDRKVSWREITFDDIPDLLSPAEKTKLDNTIEEMGIPQARANIENLDKVIAETNTAKGRINALFLSILKSKNRTLTIVLMVLFLAVLPILAWLIRDHFQSIVGAIATFMAGLAGFLATITRFFGKALEKLNKGISVFEDTRNRVEKKLEEKKSTIPEAENILEAEINSLKSEQQNQSVKVTQAKLMLEAKEKELKEFNEQRSLATFLDNRTKSEDYKKYLGLLSTVRKDFQTLIDKMINPETNTGQGSRKISRIILYIDDLDRCPSEKVVEVLRAVHLLLAYPLFVVVVGVDPGWMLRSLESSYMVLKKDGAKKDELQDVAIDADSTPQHFLEKIFQVPFTLRPMKDTGFERLMGNLLGVPDLADKSKSGDGVGNTDNQNGQNQAAQAASNINNPGQTTTQTNPGTTGGTQVSPAAANSNDNPIPAPAGNKPGTEPPKKEEEEEFEVQEQALVINKWEAKFATELFPFILTPRTAKRFTNIYRLVKANVPATELAAFEGTEEVPGNFQVPMLFLSMLLGIPDEAAEFLPFVYNKSLEGISIADSLQDFVSTPDPSNNNKTSIQKHLQTILDRDFFPDNAGLTKQWMPVICRFSFELGKMDFYK